jgi:hypothetical protein
MTEVELITHARERVRTLGLVFIGLGCVELSWVFFCVFGGLLLGVAGFADIDMGEYLWLGTAAYWLIGLACTPIALLHIGTGVRLRQKGGLVLAIISLASCMVTIVLALYCFPFTLGAGIYAVIVLMDPDARAVMEAS